MMKNSGFLVGVRYQLGEWCTERTAYIAAFFVWLNIVLALVLKHEYWRDEVRSYILAIESPSFWRIFQHVYNDGHPALWNYLLWGYNRFFHDGIVITLLGLTIGILATGLFLFRSPFHPLFKISYIFGALPLYEYTVMARHYGLAMLLLYCYSCLPGCLEDILLDGLLPALLLFLLANTNLIGLIVVLALLPLLLLELRRRSRLGTLQTRHVAALVIVLCGAALSLYTLLPTSTSPQLQMPLGQLVAPSRLLGLAATTLGQIGASFYEILGMTNLWASLYMILLVGLVTWKNWRLGLAVALAVLVFVFTTRNLYPLEFRHQGVIFSFILAAFWMIFRVEAAAFGPHFWRRPYVLTVQLVLVPWLVFSLAGTVKKYREDFHWHISCARAAGEFIASNKVLRNAIILGEEDLIIDPLRYYLKNPIYNLRQHEFSAYMRLDTRYRADVSLQDLLNTAEMLRDSFSLPVIIALSRQGDIVRDMRLKGKFESDKRINATALRGAFTATAEQVREFVSRTVLLAEFDTAMGDENYVLYLLPREKELDDYFARHGDMGQQLGMEEVVAHH